VLSEKTKEQSKLSVTVLITGFIVHKTLSNIRLGVIQEYGFLVNIHNEEDLDRLVNRFKVVPKVA
jgi:hypothetical protein